MDIDSRLGDKFRMIPEKVFAGLSVMVVAGLLQISLVIEKLIFSQSSVKDSMKHFIVVRQNDKLFINLFNKVWVSKDVENLFQARFISESNKNYPKDALHRYAGNEPTMKWKDAVASNLLGELYTIDGDNKIPVNCKYPLATC